MINDMNSGRHEDIVQSGEPYSPVTGKHNFLNPAQYDHHQCSSSNLSRSSAISVCSSGNLSSSGSNNSKCMITVVVPGCNRKHNSIELVVDLKSRLENVLRQVSVLIGLVDADLFGLAQKLSLMEDEYHFLDLDRKLQSVIPRDVLKGMRRSTSGFFRKQTPSHFSDQSAMTLYLRVVCYVDNPAVIRDCVALQLYYDQLRENALEYGQLIVPESCFTLGALALQADQQPFPYSSFFESKSQTPEEIIATVPNRIIPEDILSFYVPDWIVKNQGVAFCSSQLPRLQQELCEMSRIEAQLMYCRYASQRPFHHNIHLYGIKRKKIDSYHTLWLGIGFKGIDIFEDVEGRYKKLIGTFDWASIAKIQTNGKCIEMRVVGGKHKYTYWTDSEDRASNLLRLVRLAHQLQLQLTRTTDSRLQVTPAFRQDFPTLRRVLNVSNNSNPPPVAVKPNVQARDQKPPTPKQPNPAKQPESVTSSHQNQALQIRESLERHFQTSEKEGAFDNQAFAESPNFEKSRNSKVSNSRESSLSLRAKAISLDMLNIRIERQSVDSVDENDRTVVGNDKERRLVASSESQLYATSEAIQPVRL